MQNIALNQVRPVFATIRVFPRRLHSEVISGTVVVRVNPDSTPGYGISPEEAVTAVNNASAVLPSGNVRTGSLMKIASPMPAIGGDVQELMNAHGSNRRRPAVYLRDIGIVEVATRHHQGYAQVNGRPHGVHSRDQARRCVHSDVINGVRAACRE